MIKKVPVIIQMEALECGAASLDMILAYYGKWIPLEQVRIDCGVSRNGSNAINIVKAANHYGLEAKGYRFEPEDLKKQGQFPCIIHWDFNHFVVLNGFKGNKACITDPAKGYYKVSMEDFDKSFTGICLLFKPTKDFVPSGHPKRISTFIKKRLKGSSTAIFFTVITGIISILMNVISPAFSRVLIDNLLTGKNPKWLMSFIALLLIFYLIQLLVIAIKSVYNLKISGKMDAVGNTSYFWKVLRLPMSFFSQRMTGDILSRQSSNATITNTIINTLSPLILESITMVFYLIVMLKYNVMLTLIGVSAMLISTLVSQYISKLRTNITRVSMRDSANLSSMTVSGISMIETIKSSGAENGFFSKWAGYQASVNQQNIKNKKISLYLGMIPQFVSSAANYAVLIIGVFLTMHGKFTVGMIMAFQGFLTSFISPAEKLSNAGQEIQEIKTDVERIEDVMEYPQDNVFAEEGSDSNPQKLKGNIELKNIFFGYSPLADPLIKDFSLSIKTGESVAIVGTSGCGKSTISKLISGLIKPWSGEILFDGKPINEIDKSVFHSSVGVVDQDIVLFEDTISNNIKMWDDSIQDFEVILAARDAQLHDDIMQRSLGYQHRLSENGSDFSGGQRQRMEIARVLAQDPTIIILDEATSALDAKTEFNLVNAIRMRGITTIVIAHRLSTIRSCDKIIVLKDGVIKDFGTHEILMQTSEIYRSLVQAE